jgi:murein DD-endopeptidase MepM/ murein hydrolase activator NlpD
MALIITDQSKNCRNNLPDWLPNARITRVDVSTMRSCIAPCGHDAGAGYNGRNALFRDDEMFRITFLATAVFLALSPAHADTIQPDGGAGVAQQDVRDHISEEQRARILERLVTNRKSLRERGLLPGPAAPDGVTSAHPLFDWPLGHTTSDPGYFAISNFLDQDAEFPDKLRDYHCGTRTYDTASGYNHKGLDVFSWPFKWLKMDNDEVQVLAGAAGTIIGKDDGNFDRNCSFVGDWNAVYVEHADGSVAWYGHLKKNSLTSKTVGQSVVAGEFLGVIGSSGNSTGPHLHLEVYDSGNKLVDPSQGACNTITADTWWNSQRPYYEAGINMVATHDAPPVMDNGCGVAETPNFQQSFAAGQTVYFAIYLRDQQAGQQVDLKIYQPDGTVWREWEFSRESPAHYAASWWYWNWNLPAVPQTGTWRWNVTFQGQQAESTFQVGDGMFMDGFEAD